MMGKLLKSTGAILTLGILLVAFNIGGSAGCGGEGGGGGSGDSGTSSDASKGATSAALGASGNGADSGAGAAGLVVQALKVKALKAATINIPETTETFTFPCASGSMSGSVTVSGTVTTDDATGDLTSLDMDLSQTGTFDSCTPEDIASTTDVDESDYTLDGSLIGTGSFSATMGNVSFQFNADGDLTISGACDGTLTFDMEVSGEGSLEAFSCEGNGSVSGTVCGTTVACTISGDCENPTISGTGC